MPEVPDTCYWLEDRCERPAIGSTSHPVHGVIPICGPCQQTANAPLINTSRKVS